MPTSDEPRSRQALWWTAAAVLLVLAVAQALAPQGAIGDLTYLLGLWIPAAVAIAGASRPGPRRAARVLLAAGVTATAWGDLLWTLQAHLTGREPTVSWPDIPWMASYLLVGAALLVCVSERRARLRDDRDALIDLAVVAVLATLVVTELWSGPMVVDQSAPVLDRVIWATYPVLDAVLLCLLVRLLVDRSVPRSIIRPLSVGVLCWLVADFGFLVIGQTSILAGPMNATWMLGSAALAGATWTMISPAVPMARTPRPVSTVRLGVAYLGLLVPWLFVLHVATDHDAASDHRAELVAPFVAAVVVTALVWLRTLTLLRLQRRATDRLGSSERLFRKLALNSSDAVLVLDRNGILQREAPGLAELVGIPDAGAIGDDIVGASDEERATDGTARALLLAALASDGAPVEEELHLTWDGDERWLAVRAVNLLSDPDVEGIVVTLTDVTDRKRMEALLVHQASHDHLTGLANRALFLQRLDDALVRALATAAPPSVLYIDLDGFKYVNDSLGHDVGDDLLRGVASRMLLTLRPGDTVARLGGDEFVVLLEETDDPVAAADRVLAALEDPVVLAHGPIALSASIGIATASPGSTPGSMLREADTAMYRAKRAGRGRSVAYEPSMRDESLRRLQLENDLRSALARDELRLAYQPVVDVADAEIVGFEALLRWQHPQLGEIGPDEFVPVAEEIGAVGDIGRWVLHQACRQAARWQVSHRGDLTMAVNVSGRQLESGQLDIDVRDALAESGLDPATLVLEITETSLITDDDTALRAVTGLRSLGVGLAVDDFGTGYSSLSHLHRYPVDVIKIDRSFMTGARGGPGDHDLVRGLVDLAHVMGLTTVAEGVETPAQLERLRQLGCDLAQGYLFSKPLDPEQAEAVLRVRRRRKPAPSRSSVTAG